MTERIQLARLTSSGIEEFRSYLVALRGDSTLSPPRQLLTDKNASEPITSAPTIEERHFETKRDSARYLVSVLAPLKLEKLTTDVGLWSWLALHFFDSICRPQAGKRKARADAHYILNTDYKRVYRHLLRTPYVLSESIPKFNQIFLNQPVDVHGELIEQVAGGRLKVIRIPSVAEAIERLYLDPETGAPKKGATSERRRGNLRSRFPVRLDQLSMTYDIAGMSATELIDALGEEFRGWYVPKTEAGPSESLTPGGASRAAGTSATLPQE